MIVADDKGLNKNNNLQGLEKTAPVSVVIPAYNCAATILDAIDSITSQTVMPFELIVVDDASNDDTKEVVLNIQKKLKPGWLKYIKLENNVGAGVARNVGWNLAGGECIAFLDADDVWHERKIEIQWNIMIKNPSVSLCGHKYRYNFEDKGTYGGDVDIEIESISKVAILMRNAFSTPSVMIRKDVRFRFHPTKRYSEDYLLWLKVVLGGYKCIRLNAKLVTLNKRSYGEGGLSSHLGSMALGELDNYVILYREGYINIISTFMLVPYSFLKFVKRLIVVSTRKLWFVKN